MSFWVCTRPPHQPHYHPAVDTVEEAETLLAKQVDPSKWMVWEGDTPPP